MLNEALILHLFRVRCADSFTTSINQAINQSVHNIGTLCTHVVNQQTIDYHAARCHVPELRSNSVHLIFSRVA